MTPRTVSLIGVACVLTGWLAASVVSPRVASLQSTPAPVPAKAVIAPDSDARAPYTDRLRMKLHESNAPPAPKRNPFAFGQPPRAVKPPSARGTRPAVESSTLDPVPSGPSFELLGIGTTRSPEGVTQTAVITTTGSVLLVREGEVLPGGYRVVRVLDDSVVLVKDTGGELRLRLK